MSTQDAAEPAEPADTENTAEPDPAEPAGIRGWVRALPGRLRTLAAPADALPDGAAPQSRTLGELTRRRLALLLLVVLTTGVLYPAFQGVHADARPLRSSSAPGLLAIDTAMDELTQAQTGVDAGSSGDFHTRISVANQSLARAAGDGVAGLFGRQTIQTVTGLIATYSGWIEDAAAQPADSALHKAYLKYAKNMLGAVDDTAAGTVSTKAARPETAVQDDTTILGRLRELRDRQQAVVAHQSDFGPLLWTLWSLAAVLAVLLACLLVEAALFTGRRFRRRWNPALAGAVLLLAGGWVTLALFTWSTHSAMAHARGVLAPALTRDDIPVAGAAVSGRLAGTGFHAAAAGWLVAGGVALAVLVLLGLQPRINEYRFGVSTVRLPRPRTAGVGVLCLAVVAAGSAVAVQAAGWHGSVTLLANWTGPEQREFQRKVIDPFEHDYRIHVVYQGSSAESQVLDADVETGTPPDVAVLPGPGELAQYASKNLLTPLDDVVRPAGFAATWVPTITGPDNTPHRYWVPIKTDLKSMVWHPASLGDKALRTAAATPDSWCLGMASDATSGWPGSDWIEDILLQQSGVGDYQKWVNGELDWKKDPVRRAWTTWADMVHSRTAGRTEDALLTSYADAAQGVLKVPRTCELEHQSSFARSSPAWNGTKADFTHSAAVIPNTDPEGPTRWEVSGDLAAVFHDTPQARKLIGFLASDTAQRAWAGSKYGFSVKGSVLADHQDPSSTVGQVVRDLSDPRAVHCYDASDAMPPTVRDAFSQAVLRYLADPKATLDQQLDVMNRAVDKAGRTPKVTVCSPEP